VKVRASLIRKQEIVNTLVDFIKSSKTIAVVDVTGARTSLIEHYRKLLKDVGAMLKFAKNTLFKKAIEASSVNSGLEELKDYLAGQNAFIFSSMNPFKLQILIEKNKIPIEARAGTVATNDIVVPEGNTGIPSGPDISLFTKFNIPTKIMRGTIHIVKPTVVAKKGDVISADLAQLLSKLGIKPLEGKLKIKVVYHEGRLLKADELALNLEEYINELREAARRAIAVATEAEYPTPETAPVMLSMAYTRSLRLAVEAEYPEKETLKRALGEAVLRAMKLRQALGDLAE
jgi:large subunit ribosomal protein L10